VRLIRRSSVVALAAAALVVSPILGGAAHAEGSYTCFGGDLTPEEDGYRISANPCDGWGGVNVTVVLRFGAYAGTYQCRSAFSWNGFLGAEGCTPIAAL
jgi:hypothetical protein